MARFTRITTDAEFASYEDRLDHVWSEGPPEDYTFPVAPAPAFDPWGDL